MTSSRRNFLAAASALWSRAVASAQTDINAAQREIERARHPHGPAAEQLPKYKFAFFTPAEQAQVRTLAARIVPADERSGGAAAARVEEYIDFVLGHAAPRLQTTWRQGLARLAPRVKGRTGEQIDAYLETLAAREFTPQSADEQFWVLLKGAVTESFYTSREGIERELGYQGMGFVMDFRGCEHASHATPSNYTPLLRQQG